VEAQLETLVKTPSWRYKLIEFLPEIQSLWDKLHCFHELRRNQLKNRDELREIQVKRLKAMLRYAYDYVPYYHKLFNSVEFRPEDLRDNEDLRKIPITTKLDVKKNFLDFLVAGADPAKYTSCWTSGSTGIPTNVLVDRNASSYSLTLHLYGLMECGVQLTDKLFSIGSSSPSKQPKITGSKLGRLNFLRLSPNNLSADPRVPIDEIVKALNRSKPDVIYGFTSVLEDLCLSNVPKIRPRLIFSHGELLTEQSRRLLEDVFGAEVCDTYGSTEFWRLAFECNEHSGLHLITDCAVVECVKDGDVVACGESGEVVVTGLYNYVMPLIRYELGDIATPIDDECSCGRSWPMLKMVEGRTSDKFILPSGRALSSLDMLGWVFPELKDHVWCISQYQIVQESRNKIVLRIVKGRQYDDKLVQVIIDKARKDLEGEDVTLSMEIVNEIPKEKSGKRRKIISYVSLGG
jgi:phenylacetate-CoA ligase